MSKPEFITLAHGNGGRFMRELIENLFARYLANPDLDTQGDAVTVDGAEKLVVSVDGFTVQPLTFPGGDIGSLAVHGTVNDLAVSGARPRYLTLSAIIEEGMRWSELEGYVSSLATAAKKAGVSVITGDTKIVPRGFGGGVYFITSGIGSPDPGLSLGMDKIASGDQILLSGSVGDHGTCVMLAREEFGLQGDLKSDSACVLPFCQALGNLPGVHFMRDPTRGGLATVAHEIAQASQQQVRLFESAIPVKPPVQSVCEILGYDPYYLACEGRVIAIVAPDSADAALRRWQALPDGDDAAIIGQIEDQEPLVILQTELGGERLLDELEDSPLPRIC